MKAEEFYSIRKRLGLSQEELAERLGTTGNSVSRWELGAHPIPMLVAYHLDSMYMITGGGDGSRDKRNWAGWFYVIQLAPDLKPERLKFGFARYPHERLIGHRVSSPTCTLLRQWPAIWADEPACIEKVVNDRCTRLTAEAYDVDDLQRVLKACASYFEWADEFEHDDYTKLLKTAHRSRPDMDAFVERLERLKEDWADLH